MLYELLTGRHPHDVTGPMADVLGNITDAEPAPLGAEIPDDAETQRLEACRAILAVAVRVSGTFPWAAAAISAWPPGSCRRVASHARTEAWPTRTNPTGLQHPSAANRRRS